MTADATPAPSVDVPDTAKQALETTWYRDLVDGVGTASDLDRALRGALVLGTTDTAIELAVQRAARREAERVAARLRAEQEERARQEAAARADLLRAAELQREHAAAETAHRVRMAALRARFARAYWRVLIGSSVVCLTVVVPWLIGRSARDVLGRPAHPGVSDPSIRSDGDYFLSDWLFGGATIAVLTGALLLSIAVAGRYRCRLGVGHIVAAVVVLAAVPALAGISRTQWNRAESESARSAVRGPALELAAEPESREPRVPVEPSPSTTATAASGVPEYRHGSVWPTPVAACPFSECHQVNVGPDAWVLVDGKRGYGMVPFGFDVGPIIDAISSGRREFSVLMNEGSPRRVLGLANMCLGIVSETELILDSLPKTVLGEPHMASAVAGTGRPYYAELWDGNMTLHDLSFTRPARESGIPELDYVADEMTFDSVEAARSAIYRWAHEYPRRDAFGEPQYCSNVDDPVIFYFYHGP